jgi:hypothetical protein
LFPAFRLMPIHARALLALAVAPTNNTPSLRFYCCPLHPESTQVPSTLYIISSARPLLIAAAGHQRGTLPLHNRACILLPPAPHFAVPPFTHIPFHNRSLRPASRHTFSSHTIPSTPHPSEHAVRPPFLSKVFLLCIPISSRTDFVVSQLPLLQNIVQTSWPYFVLLLPIAFNPLALRGRRILSLLLPKLSPLNLPPKLPLLTCGRLAKSHPRGTSRLISPSFRY